MSLRFLFASDSFKGTLSSAKTAELLAQAAREIFPDCRYRSLEVADGGEGTTDAVLASTKGERIEVRVHDPLFQAHIASYGKIDETRALMEMASASGLPLVPQEKRNPLHTTSYGTGEMIKDALDRGFRDISIAIGGSATNDGGMGAMAALGIRFLDEAGKVLTGFGKDLAKVRKIDLSGLDKRLAECKITVMCDVNNVLCGEHGATYTFGRQKGASDEILQELEAGMCNYRNLILEQFHIDCNQIAGAGAAGGLGAALLVFLNARLESGVERVLSLVGFDEALEGTDFVITGEGATDWQSCFGKVLYGVGRHAHAKGVPALAIVGSMGRGAEDIFAHGIESIVTCVNAPMELKDALDNAETLYLSAARRLFRILRCARQ